ncbi:MAG: magnesium transporter [Chloroflexi bacterium]|nr:magnesium transporter [Chloroflexota bacterium]
MADETTGGRPSRLDDVQESIEGQLSAGASAAAATELSALRPPDRADVLEELDAPGREALLGELSAESIAEIVEHLDAETAAELPGLIDVASMAQVLDEAPPEVAADILRAVEWEIARDILALMTEHRSVARVLLYADDDAGGLMTPDVVGLNENISVSRALQILRDSPLPHQKKRQLFVVDSPGRLVGRIGLSGLVFAPPGARISDVMDQDVIHVETGTDQEECARIMSRYGLRSLPVVDRYGVLEGAVAIEEMVRVAEDEATEDMLKMVGTAGDERLTGPLRNSIRNRFPWLLVNLGTVLFAGVLVSLFDGTIERLAIIAAFIPVVSGQAGIAGTQTVTLMVRALALGDVSERDSRKVLVREGVLALVQGVVIASLLGLVVWAWQADFTFGLIVFAALLANLVLAAIAGVLVPFGMRALHADPATSSAVLVTTVTDSAGILIYLSLAAIFLSSMNAA